MSEQPVFTVIQRGTEQFPRYIVSKGDVVHNAVYWDETNNEWQDDEEKATVYADVNEVMWVHHSLRMETLKDLPCHHYTIPIRLELYGKKPEDIEEFREWLTKAVRIVVNSPDYGYGPEGSFGVIFADFSKTREKK